MTPLTRRGVLSAAAAGALALGLDLRAAKAALGTTSGRRVWRHPHGGRVVLEPFANRLRREGAGGFRHEEAGAAPWQLNRPYGAAVAPDGRVAVANTGNDEVLVFDAAGARVARFGDLSGPRDVAFAADGRIFVAETRGRRVSVLDADGRATWIDGLHGPVALVLVAGGAIVADDARVLRIDGAGRITGSVALESRALGLAADADGQVWVAAGDTVRRLDGGAAFECAARPLALDLDEAGLRVMTA